MKALSLWAEKGFGGDVGIGPKDGEREAGNGVSHLEACCRHSQPCPVLPFVFLLAKTLGPVALGGIYSTLDNTTT